MTGEEGPSELVVLAADGSMAAALEEVLKRHGALGIRQITYDIVIHPYRDPGVLNGAAAFLQAQARNLPPRRGNLRSAWLR